MKNLFATIVLLLAINTLNAQLRVGIKASASKVLGTPEAVQYGDQNGRLAQQLDYISTNNLSSFGMTAEYQAGNLFAQAEVMYRKSSVTFGYQEFTEEAADAQIIVSDVNQMIHMPISAGVKISNLKLGVGPIFDINIKNDLGLSQVEEFNTEVRKMNMGFQFLIGYELFNHVQLDLKFERSFRTVGDHYELGNNERQLEASPNMVTLGVALML